VLLAAKCEDDPDVVDESLYSDPTNWNWKDP